MAVADWELAAIGLTGIGTKDVIGTLLVVAEAKGRYRTAGLLAPAMTVASLVIYGGAGATLLHQAHGRGLPWLAPILAADAALTLWATRHASRARTEHHERTIHRVLDQRAKGTQPPP